MSDLAASLFSKLTAIQASNRYNSTEALNHPWISRKKDTRIPLSFMEQVTNIEFEHKLNSKIQLLRVLALVAAQKSNQNCFVARKFIDYKKKIKTISKKIERWHTQTISMQSGIIEQDDDFQMSLISPSKFSSSSSDDDVKRCGSQQFSGEFRFGTKLPPKSILGSVRQQSNEYRRIKQPNVIDMTPTATESSVNKSKYSRLRAQQYVSHLKTPV